MAAKDRKKQKKISDFAEAPGGGGRAAKMSDSAGTGSRASAVPEDGAASVNLIEILQEIKLFRTEISAKTDKIDGKIDLIQAKFQVVEDRIATLEERISALEDRLPPLEAARTDHAVRLTSISSAVDGQENRGRRNNVRLIGLPEGCETGPPSIFYEELLKKLLPTAHYTKFYSVVRAHRTLGPRPPPGAPPRAVLVRFLHYRDRDAVIAAARDAGDLHYENVQVRVYQDLSMAVQKERKKFDAAKKLLRERGVKYSMMFPAKLRVEARGKVSFFTCPKDACRFIEMHTDMVQAPAGATGQEGIEQV